MALNGAHAGSLSDAIEFSTPEARMHFIFYLFILGTLGPLQATLSNLLTYRVLRPTQPPTLSGTGNE